MYRRSLETNFIGGLVIVGASLLAGASYSLLAQDDPDYIHDLSLGAYIGIPLAYSGMAIHHACLVKKYILPEGARVITLWGPSGQKAQQKIRLSDYLSSRSQDKATRELVSCDGMVPVGWATGVGPPNCLLSAVLLLHCHQTGRFPEIRRRWQ